MNQIFTGKYLFMGVGGVTSHYSWENGEETTITTIGHGS
jgi:hypothetical protein